MFFPRTRRAHSRAGQSLTEFAITLPILLLIMFGAIDLGRLFFDYVTITNASREGARFGITAPRNTEGIKNRVTNESSGRVSVSDETIKIECAPFDFSASYNSTYCPTAHKGDRMRVTVNYNFQFTTFYLFGLSNMTLSNFTTMAIVNEASN